MTRRRFCSSAHRQLAEWAAPLGWSWTITAGNHVRWHHPRVTAPLFTSGTPSDCKSVVQAKTMLRRALERPERGSHA